MFVAFFNFGMFSILRQNMVAKCDVFMLMAKFRGLIFTAFSCSW